jgi:hypothetical protein
LLERLFYPDFPVSSELHDSLPLAARHHSAEFIADELLQPAYCTSIPDAVMRHTDAGQMRLNAGLD